MCCVGSGLCDELITRAEECYCVCVCLYVCLSVCLSVSVSVCLSVSVCVSFFILLSISMFHYMVLQGGSNMTGTDLCVNKPHCAAAVRP